MPSTSAKQSKFMRAIAHSPSFAKKVGVKQSVGKDFEMADKKAKKFGEGGATASKPKPKPPEDGTNGLKIPPGGYNDPYEKMPPKMKPEPRKPLGPMGKKGYASGGVAKVMPTSKQMGDMNMKKGGKIKKYAFGGAMPAPASGQGQGPATAAAAARLAGRPMPAPAPPSRHMPAPAPASSPLPAPAPTAPSRMKKGGQVKKKATKAGAAMVKKSADTMGRAMKFAKGGGIETKGKTKGKKVTMKSGGSC